MTWAEFRAEVDAIEARIATTGIRHDDVLFLRRAVTAWDRAGQPTTGALFAAFEAASAAVDLACTRALEVAVAESQRRHLIEKLQREVDALNAETAREARIRVRQERARLAQLRNEHGAADVATAGAA